jgi:peptidoglycan/xylan/chitin deacetylase (PgdA/CDA1 family)
MHRISNERNLFWNPIKPATFDLLLSYVKKHYRVIGFNHLDSITIEDQGKPYLILSFDDGYYDFYEHALPLLIKHNLPCNHNIVNDCADMSKTIWTERLNIIFNHHLNNAIPFSIEFADRNNSVSDYQNSWMKFYLETFKQLLNIPVIERESIISKLESATGIDTSCRMMSWNDIKECAANQVEIGSHTYSHDSLGTISNHTELEKEILQSKNQIEEKLGKSISTLALPNGQTGSKADAVISNSDYKFVLYVNDDLNSLPLKNEGPIHISRINLVDEPFPQMALRLEQFHKIMRTYV